MAVPRPAQLTYNDLNGAEAQEILVDWFRQLLSSHPLMQRHLTLPNVRISLNIEVLIDMFMGGSVPVESPPEQTTIRERVTLENLSALMADLKDRLGLHAVPPEVPAEATYSTVVNAAPIAGGKPPDQIRFQHGLAISRPGYGPRDTGSHMFLADIPDRLPTLKPGETRQLSDPIIHPPPPPPSATGGREGEVAAGYTFSPQVVTPNAPGPELVQRMPADRGSITLDLKGDGISHAGITVRAPDHYRSVKEQGDQKGDAYSSVNGVYDPGARGLMSSNRQGGYGTDGRPRISFGNDHKG